MRGTRFVSLVLLVGLLTPALVSLPGGSAQEPMSPGNLVVPDPVGDVGPLGLLGANNPAAGATAHVDIHRVEIGNEAADSFEILVEVGGFGSPEQMLTEALALVDFRCMVEWSYVHGVDDLRYDYSLSWTSDILRVPGSDPDSTTRWGWYYYDGNRGMGRSMSPWPGGAVVFDPDASAFRVDVPKVWAPVWPGGHAAGAGDTLELGWVFCMTDVAAYSSWWDMLDTDGSQRYPFQIGGTTGDIRLSFSPGDAGDESSGAEAMHWEPPVNGQDASHLASVAPERASLIPLFVGNSADSRRLVQLSAEVGSEAAAGWNVTITPSIMVPAGQQRVVNLVVTPPASAVFGEKIPVTVTGETPGTTGLSSVSAALQVMPPLSAEHNTLYVHAEKFETSDTMSQVVYTVVPPHRIGASLLVDDPNYDDEPASVGAIQGVGGYGALNIVSQPVRLDGAQPIEVVVAMEGGTARTVPVRMYLGTEEDTLLSIYRDVPTNGATTIEAFLPDEDVFDLEPGTTLYFEMFVSSGGLGPDAVEEVALVPRETYISLPVVNTGQSFEVTDGRYLPSLALASGEESGTYLNPGKGYAFDLVLSNEGLETDDLRLRVESENASGWGVDIKPGHSFRVPAGNSTPFSVVITASPNAAEGAHAFFDVIAESRNDVEVRTKVQLDVIVTTGVEVEGKAYEEKEDQLPPLDEANEEAPGAPLVLVVLGMLSLVALRRRR